MTNSTKAAVTVLRRDLEDLASYIPDNCPALHQRVRAALTERAAIQTAGEAVYQLRSLTGHGEWQATDADGATCLKRMPHWVELYEFRTLYATAQPIPSPVQEATCG